MKKHLQNSIKSAAISRVVNRAMETNRPVYLLVIATKPCFIKLASLIWSMTEKELPFLLINSNQHYDKPLTAQIREFGYNELINFNMNSKGDCFNERIINMSHSVKEFVHVFSPYLGKAEFIPIVSGDTFSAGIIPQLFYYSTGIRSIHVEAGLRSYGPGNRELWKSGSVLNQTEWEWESYVNDPFPEGMDSRLASISSELLLAPVERNKKNLIEEGYSSSNINIVGSLSSDAVNLIVKNDPENDFLNRYPFLANGKWLRVDLHRRENLHPDKLKAVLESIKLMSAAGMNVLLIKSNALIRALKWYKLEYLLDEAEKAGVRISELWPSYSDVIHFMKSDHCLGLYTDSGGLQEEANVLGVPCFTSRFSTDRPETILEARTNLLVPPISGDFISRQIISVFDKGIDKVFLGLAGPTIYGTAVSEKMATILCEYEPRLNIEKTMLNY